MELPFLIIKTMNDILFDVYSHRIKRVWNFHDFGDFSKDKISFLLKKKANLNWKESYNWRVVCNCWL
jgi:hypothetical protein